MGHGWKAADSVGAITVRLDEFLHSRRIVLSATTANNRHKFGKDAPPGSQPWLISVGVGLDPRVITRRASTASGEDASRRSAMASGRP